MIIQQEILLAEFGDRIAALNGPSNEGLRFIAMGAVIIWRAHALGASRAQIEELFRSQNLDSARRRRFISAISVARDWEQNGLPESVRRANSIEAAYEATMTWLRSKGIRSEERFWNWQWKGIPEATVENQLQRITKSFSGALRGVGGWADFTPTDFAESFIDSLSDEQAEEFYRGVVDAYVRRIAGKST